MGKTRKKKVRKKLAGQEKGRERTPPALLSPVYSRFIFVFALSQFSGPDYLRAWNRLPPIQFPALTWYCAEMVKTDVKYALGVFLIGCLERGAYVPFPTSNASYRPSRIPYMYYQRAWHRVDPTNKRRMFNQPFL